MDVGKRKRDGKKNKKVVLRSNYYKEILVSV